MNSNGSLSKQPLLIIVIIILLVVLGFVTYYAAVKGRIKSMPEEVTKGIKAETPFPSHLSSNRSNSSVYPQLTTHSRGSSSVDVLNLNDFMPPDFVIDESTYIVRREFIPKKRDELPIKKNQILSVKEIYEDGWCTAISAITGEMGVVPIQCLEKYSDLIRRKREYQQLKQQQLQQQYQIQIQPQIQSQFPQQFSPQFSPKLPQQIQPLYQNPKTFQLQYQPQLKRPQTPHEQELYQMLM